MSLAETRGSAVNGPPAVPTFDHRVHDALVVVHPTWAKPRDHKYYPYRLLDAIDAAQAAGRTVFLVPDEGLYHWLGRQLSKRTLCEVPNHLRNFHVKRRCVRRRLQREVDFIADRLGKRPSSIRLGFAGMFADACVFLVAQSWCRNVTPWYPEEVENRLRRALPRRPIARGDILEDLVVGFNDSEHTP